MPTKEQVIAAIARDCLGFETLEPRNRDALDFKEVGVGSLREALERAFEAGRRSARPAKATCPACGRSVEVRPL